MLLQYEIKYAIRIQIIRNLTIYHNFTPLVTKSSSLTVVEIVNVHNTCGLYNLLTFSEIYKKSNCFEIQTKIYRLV